MSGTIASSRAIPPDRAPAPTDVARWIAGRARKFAMTVIFDPIWHPASIDSGAALVSEAALRLRQKLSKSSALASWIKDELQEPPSFNYLRGNNARIPKGIDLPMVANLLELFYDSQTVLNDLILPYAIATLEGLLRKLEGELLRADAEIQTLTAERGELLSIAATMNGQLRGLEVRTVLGAFASARGKLESFLISSTFRAALNWQPFCEAVVRLGFESIRLRLRSIAEMAGVGEAKPAAAGEGEPPSSPSSLYPPSSVASSRLMQFVVGYLQSNVDRIVQEVHNHQVAVIRRGELSSSASVFEELVSDVYSAFVALVRPLEGTADRWGVVPPSGWDGIVVESMHAVLKLAIQAALVEPALWVEFETKRPEDGYDGEIIEARKHPQPDARQEGIWDVRGRVTHGGKTDTAILLYADGLTCYAFGREAVDVCETVCRFGEHLKQLPRAARVVVLVGNFANSPVLQATVRSTFEPANHGSGEAPVKRSSHGYGIRITRPAQAGDPRERVYEVNGQKLVRNALDMFVELGDVIEMGSVGSRLLYPLHSEQNSISFEFFATKK
ncbi:hypothetical protein DFJ73DRAFT_941948 [Zopfochytrium polystomum]|nr:hypothetical protein DFJ73DRAFT_941948 [Zopfochytrium polystomum]